jgi:hypothetical protein
MPVDESLGQRTCPLTILKLLSDVPQEGNAKISAGRAERQDPKTVDPIF